MKTERWYNYIGTTPEIYRDTHHMNTGKQFTGILLSGMSMYVFTKKQWTRIYSRQTKRLLPGNL
jgi:hypothetical protein